MPLLLIETASERAIVAIVEADQLLYHNELPFGLNNSIQLASAIDEGLKKLKLKAAQLSGVAVGIGPGSYTGIRVGAAIAEAIAYAASIKLIGVCTLECFAPKDFQGRFAVMIDAKIGGAYLQLFEASQNRIIALSEPEICPLERIAEKLDGIALLISPNCQRLKPKIVYNENRLWLELPPNPIRMAQLAMVKFERNDFDKAGSLQLLYLRKTQAEEEFVNKHRTISDGASL
jgi:tRNA threonylcarbamoyl adenosine modification protein YeaZ